VSKPLCMINDNLPKGAELGVSELCFDQVRSESELRLPSEARLASDLAEVLTSAVRLQFALTPSHVASDAGRCESVLNSKSDTA
jgi:hypothetical protein